MERNRTHASDDESSRGDSSGRERFWTRRDGSSREGDGGEDMDFSWRRQNRSIRNDRRSHNSRGRGGGDDRRIARE